MTEKYMTVGYMGAMIPEDVDNERARLELRHGAPVDKWFIDTWESTGEFLSLINRIRQGDIKLVIHNSVDFLPNHPSLVGKFYDAAMEHGTEIRTVGSGGTSPMQKLFAQMVPLIHEWGRTEADFMAARGQHTAYMDTTELEALRRIVKDSGDPATERLLRILPDLSEEPEDDE